MAAIPSSDLPGHRRLHERASLALERCQEDTDIDFKESADWDTLKWPVTKAVLGMANLRDGGVIVIGVTERDSTWSLTGIDPGHLSTFSPDVVTSQVNAHVSPFAELDIVLVTHTDKRAYLAIYVREFRDTPVVCRKNGPDKSGVVEGRVYVRLSGPPRTTVVTDARQMHDLLELAAEKRARRFLAAARRVGLSPEDGDDKRFDAELEGL